MADAAAEIVIAEVVAEATVEATAEVVADQAIAGGSDPNRIVSPFFAFWRSA